LVSMKDTERAGFNFLTVSLRKSEMHKIAVVS